jgi:hypothetical protein
LQLLISVKRLLAACSLVFLAAGWFLANSSLSILGAIVFLVSFLVEQLRLIMVFRKHARTSDDPAGMMAAEKKDAFTLTLNTTVFLLGFSGLLYRFNDHADLLFFVPGMLAVYGISLLYLLSGVILEYLIGLPMKLTAKGWKIRRKSPFSER